MLLSKSIYVFTKYLLSVVFQRVKSGLEVVDIVNDSSLESINDSLNNVWVLLVESEADVAFLVAFVFGLVGAKVIIASSSSEAVRALNCILPDLLISNTQLPDGEGASLIHHVLQIGKEHGKSIPAIALLDATEQIDPIQAQTIGFYPYIFRLVELDGLVTFAANLIRYNRGTCSCE